MEVLFVKPGFLPKVVTLLAAAVVCIVAIITHADTTYSLEILLATIIIFYIIGLIAQKIIDKVEKSNRFIMEKQENEDSNEVDEDNDDEKEENVSASEDQTN